MSRIRHFVSEVSRTFFFQSKNNSHTMAFNQIQRSAKPRLETFQWPFRADQVESAVAEMVGRPFALTATFIDSERSADWPAGRLRTRTFASTSCNAAKRQQPLPDHHSDLLSPAPLIHIRPGMAFQPFRDESADLLVVNQVVKIDLRRL